MKKILIITLALVATSTMLFAQQDSLTQAIEKRSAVLGQTGNNEIKLNLLLSVLALPELTYERLLEDNMGVGLSVAFRIDKSNVFDENYNFLAIPYFRLYFGDKKASGFFIEGNAAVLNASYPTDISYNPTQNGQAFTAVSESKTNFGLGAAIGQKFLTRNGFSGEILGGVGRLFGKDRIADAYPRLGISIGKRF